MFFFYFIINELIKNRGTGFLFINIITFLLVFFLTTYIFPSPRERGASHAVVRPTQRHVAPAFPGLYEICDAPQPSKRHVARVFPELREKSTAFQLKTAPVSCAPLSRRGICDLLWTWHMRLHLLVRLFEWYYPSEMLFRRHGWHFWTWFDKKDLCKYQ